MATGTKQKKIQRLSAGDLNPLTNLIDHLALAQHFPGDAVLNGADPVIRSPHHLAEATAMAQLLIGVARAPVASLNLGYCERGITIEIHTCHYQFQYCSPASKLRILS